LAGNRSYLTGERLSTDRVEILHEGVELIRCRVLGPIGRNFVWRTVGFLSFMATAFIRALRITKVDLVWGTSPPLFQAVSAWAIATLKRVPWLFEIRDLWPAFAVEAGVLANPILVQTALTAESFLYGHADRILINSPGFRTHIERKGADPNAISLVPNGVDVNEIMPSQHDGDLLHEQGLEGKFVALYSGAHGRANDLSLVLDAARALREDPSIVFVLVGDGPEKAQLMRSAKAQGLENIRFLPSIPKADMPDLLTSIGCGIAVLKAIPLFKTTYPNKVFDYMAAGKPVVLAIEGAIQEVIDGAQAGISVPPGDGEALAGAVTKLARDPELARAMGARGRTCVEQQFDRKILFRHFHDILEGMLIGNN
jgi:glycosyltransferase involved in cell wall biosynthesis